MRRFRFKPLPLTGAIMSALLGLHGQRALAQPLPASALPTNGQVVSGTGSITQSGNHMQVTQGSQRLVTHWDTFNIGSAARVEFVQPSASAVALNRVLSGDPSRIYGQLSANGQVFLVNPAGVLFGVEFLLIYPGLQFTAASRATLFIYTAPFIVALGSGFLLGERLRVSQWLGLLCSFAGLVVAFGIPDAARDGRQLIGDIMMVGAGIAWGATTLVIKASRLRGAPAEKVLAYQLAVSIPMLAAGALLMGERLAAPPAPGPSPAPRRPGC